MGLCSAGQDVRPGEIRAGRPRLKGGRVGLGYLVCFVTLDDMGDEHIRVGDRERDQAVARLQECHAEGRLTVEELQERIQAALAAKTGGDIDKLFVDLPGGSPQRESQVGTTPSMQETYGLSNLGSPGEGLVSYESSQESAKNKPWYNQAWVFWGVIILVMTSRGILWPLVPIVIFAMVIAPKLSRSRNRRTALPPVQPRQLTFQERDRVMREIEAGRKIHAIKLYREFTGADLRTAKNTIDAWGRDFPGY